MEARTCAFVVVVLCWVYVRALVTPKTELDESLMYVKTKGGDVAFPDDLDIRKMSNFRYMHPHGPDFHHHHHHPDFHRHNEEGDTDRNFQEETGQTSTGAANGTMQIPISFIQDINQYNVSDLLIHYVDGYNDEDVVINDRFGGDNKAEGRSAAVIPKNADCVPEVQTVKIVSSDDPTILHFPECTRIERCGGCCSHSLLACQPVEKEEIAFKVIRTQYTGTKKLKFLDKHIVLVEKHNKCKCMCRVRPEDCSKFQQYIESECRCACMNHDEEKKCLKKNDTRLWDPEVCACQCRDTVQCSTGSYFDQNECKCVSSGLKRRFASFQRRSFRSEPLSVVPLPGDD